MVRIEDGSCRVRNLSPQGVGLFVNTRLEVGSDISVKLKQFEVRGQVRWRAGVERMQDGTLMKTQLIYGTDQIETRSFLVRELSEFFGDACKGYLYVIGIQLYEPMPQEILYRNPEREI